MNTREMTEKVQDLQKKASKTARDLTEATDQCIRDNTWTGVACAALLGCIIGFLISERVKG